MKRALITGITGQDGSYLAQLLLKKNYEVHGIVRPVSWSNLDRLQQLVDPSRIIFHYADMTDSISLIHLLDKIAPNEIYHLAAQSHVGISFEMPEYTAQVNALGTLRLLEALRITHLDKSVRFYQASTSELYGKVQEIPQHEQTPFYPRSPYAAAKLYAYWMVINYREAYGLFASNGILFNHESPLRGANFVTRKIAKSLARIALGIPDCLSIGNLEARRDWGYAPDYVLAMWSILQHNKPDDFVIATGKTHSVREFIIEASCYLKIELAWYGNGEQEYAIDTRNGKKVVAVDPQLFRPTEVDVLCGDASKAHCLLGWRPTVTFKELVRLMIDAEITHIHQEPGMMHEYSI